MISLLVLLIVIGVIFWAARTLMGAFSVPQPIQTVVVVLLVLVALIAVLQAFGLSTGLPTLRLN